MKHIFFLALFLGLSTLVTAQTVSDAVRYSYLQPAGTARYMGAGGAFGALGADFGALSANPAGLAMYRTSEMVFTPSVHFAKTTATLPGEGNYGSTDDKSNFNFNNLGMVFHTEPTASKWSTFNFGIGFNRQQNFHKSVYYEGQGKGTILNNWYNDAARIINGGGSVDDFDPYAGKMASDANAIYYQDSAFSYDFITEPDATIQRNQSLLSTGGVNEMVFSFAGNYDEKLMLGATVGVPFLNYRLDGTYNESDPADAVPYFDNLTYTEFLRTSGVGINLKMGVIFRLNQTIRIGGAFHTPTFYGLTDEYSNTFSYTYTDNNGQSSANAESPSGTFDYKLRTPWRASTSLAFVLGKYGFVSGDVEWVDYSANHFDLTSRVNSTDNAQYERDLNNTIQRKLQPAINFRVGGELAVDVFRFRAGLNMTGKPYEGETGYDPAFTAGIGVRTEAFYLDFGYRHAISKGSVEPYDGAPLAALDNKGNDFLMTVGFKF